MLRILFYLLLVGLLFFFGVVLWNYRDTLQTFSPKDFTNQISDKIINSPTPNLNQQIQIHQPLTADVITSPYTIRGQARGSWFFEGQFLITLHDASGKELARTNAIAQGDWMTNEFVPFEAKIEFQPSSVQGALRFEKANPSGDTARAEHLTIHVRFR